MSEKIDLTGLDKAVVLAALYNASKLQDKGLLQYDPKPMSIEEARQLLEKEKEFDYIKGRVMKINLSGDKFDPWFYNRDNGDGAAEKAIKFAIQTGDVNNDVIKTMHKSETLKKVLYLGDKMGAFSKK